MIPEDEDSAERLPRTRESQEATLREHLERLRASTPARVFLGRRGPALPLRAVLDLQLDHARARDAVTEAFAPERIVEALGARASRIVRSRAADLPTYLARPDLGRRLDGDSAASLCPGEFDVVFVIADGLSSRAVHRHAVPTLNATLALLEGWRVGPIVIACRARVALADEVGERLGAPLAVMLIGERPGLSSPDSLGAYLTWEPRVGRLDSERNCVSNIRPPTGLSYEQAAGRLADLMSAARRARLTGFGLEADAGGAAQGLSRSRPPT
jgi:ethanolamine ammonia-lyase small subunit